MRQVISERCNVPLDHQSSMAVHVVRPAEADTRLPSVIVIHDILGFNDDTRRICDLIANGPVPLVVAAPDLYQGLGPKPICIIKTITALRKRQGVTFERLVAVQSWLSGRHDVDPDRTAVVGFCIGGGFALLYAANHEVSVVAPFYGDVPAESKDLKNICPVVGGYGERDAIFAPQGRRLVKHLETLDTPHDVKFYPDAGHSYMNKLEGFARLSRWSPMKAAYDEPAADDSWRRVFAFFEEYL